MADLAYAFVKWRGGEGAGHVAWGYDLPDGRVCIGSVENHSGHIFTPAKNIGFWQQCVDDVAAPLRERSYNDAAIFEVPRGDYVSAYRVTRWIEHSAYRAFSRNCEDDAYDVLRAYGVQHLEAPFLNWFPRWWFSKLRARKMGLDEVDDFRCHAEPVDIDATLQNLPPLHPAWRKPWLLEFHLLNLAKLTRIGIRKL